MSIIGTTKVWRQFYAGNRSARFKLHGNMQHQSTDQSFNYYLHIIIGQYKFRIMDSWNDTLIGAGLHVYYSELHYRSYSYGYICNWYLDWCLSFERRYADTDYVSDQVDQRLRGSLYIKT